jgi:hypothetical protein
MELLRMTDEEKDQLRSANISKRMQELESSKQPRPPTHRRDGRPRMGGQITEQIAEYEEQLLSEE